MPLFFVLNHFPLSTLQEDLDEYFGQFGKIKDSVVMTDKATGNPRGFAFVEVTEKTAVRLSAFLEIIFPHCDILMMVSKTRNSFSSTTTTRWTRSSWRRITRSKAPN